MGGFLVVPVWGTLWGLVGLGSLLKEDDPACAASVCSGGAVGSQNPPMGGRYAAQQCLCHRRQRRQRAGRYRPATDRQPERRRG
ncbi:hypothetical protein CUJ84_pRLN3000046 (plasmid) [Rhizobium leguminosarum]|uniref:Uncharacterized protein n=1 Tax=Rhizobium leguminosarum TaxID=384 RepID=A0A2K9ZG21_RHILE|nr:hypothetical protein CUJ84_pRLN3000046 [Rhizobium leguminosarum]